MNHLLIVINGNIDDYAFYSTVLDSVDFVIAVDGGSRHVAPLEVKPDILLGDFDSISGYSAFTEAYPDMEVVKFPPRKDYTDSELAVEFAIEQKPKRVTIVGCIGSRMDHTFATILLLKRFLDAGIDACMLDEKNEIRLINSDYDIEGEVGRLMSLVPISDKVEGIYLHGFEYPLVDATLTLGSSTGVSNVFARQKAKIELRSGMLLVFKSMD